jgi:hypothetical protein
VPDAVARTSRAMNDQFLQYVSPIISPSVGSPSYSLRIAVHSASDATAANQGPCDRLGQ